MNRPTAIDGFRGVGDVAMTREIERMGPRKLSGAPTRPAQ
jgi:hypothetical protein